MKQFLIFAGKEFRHIFRDRRTMLILLVMPVVQMRCRTCAWPCSTLRTTY